MTEPGPDDRRWNSAPTTHPGRADGTAGNEAPDHDDLAPGDTLLTAGELPPMTVGDTGQETPLVNDLGFLRPFGSWDDVVRLLDRRPIVAPLLVTWWLLATMLAQLEEQLAVMHLPGDRSFGVAALEGAGDSLAAVLATWRRWQLVNDSSFTLGQAGERAFIVTPEMVITNQLVLNLLLPLVTFAALGIASRRAWRASAAGSLRQIAAAGVVAAPVAFALVHLRAVLVAVAAFSGVTPLAAVHLFIVLVVAGASVAMAVHWFWPRVSTAALVIAVLVGAAGDAPGRHGAAGVRSGRRGGQLHPNPGPGVARALQVTGGLVRLLLAAIVGAIILASWARVRVWYRSDGPGRWLRAALAVRGQIVAVVPVAALVLLGTGDLGLQVQNAMSRLLESPVRSLLMVAGVVAVMATLAAFGQRSAVSAARRARVPLGAQPGAEPVGDDRSTPARGVPWTVLAIGVGAAVVFLVARFLPWDLVGVQAVALVVGAGAVLSGPRHVAALVETRPILDDAGPETVVARAVVVAAVPLALATVAARLAVTSSTGVSEAAAGGLLVVLAAMSVAWYHLRVALADVFAGRLGRVVVGAATAAAAVLGVWGAATPVPFGFALGAMLAFLAVVGVLAVAAGWLVLCSNRFPARGAVAAFGFRRMPLILLTLLTVYIANQLDPTSGVHDVRTIAAAAGAPRDAGSLTLAQAFDRWVPGAAHAPAASGDDGPRTPVPLVFIATAGRGHQGRLLDQPRARVPPGGPPGRGPLPRRRADPPHQPLPGQRHLGRIARPRRRPRPPQLGRRTGAGLRRPARRGPGGRLPGTRPRRPRAAGRPQRPDPHHPLERPGGRARRRLGAGLRRRRRARRRPRRRLPHRHRRRHVPPARAQQRVGGGPLPGGGDAIEPVAAGRRPLVRGRRPPHRRPT